MIPRESRLSAMRRTMYGTILKNIEGAFAALALSTVFICIIIQVFFRYVLNNSLDWPEELARYCFIVSVFIGLGFVSRRGRHLEIAAIKVYASPFMARVLFYISSAISIAFAVLMIFWGIEMTRFVYDSGQVCAAVPMPTYILYISVPVGMAIMVLRTIEHVYQVYKHGLDAPVIG